MNRPGATRICGVIFVSGAATAVVVKSDVEAITIASAVSAIFFCMRSPLREERTLETRIGCSKRQHTSL